MDRCGSRSAWRAVMRRWPTVLVTVVTLVLGGLSAPSAHGQPFTPQPPADAPVTRQAACRPSAPSVELTPGASVEVSRGSTECNSIHLSFDAGADRGYAEMILDTLRDEGVVVSFGMTGRWAQQNPDLTQRIIDEGHELINHTWSHSSFTGFSAGRPLSVAERHLELERTENLLVESFGKSTRPYFRPPYGDRNPGVYKDVSDAGYDYTMMWTIDSFGWMRISAAQIVERCVSRAEPGAIILMHVGIESEDGPALRTLIAQLRANGYELVSLKDLLGH